MEISEAWDILFVQAMPRQLPLPKCISKQTAEQLQRRNRVPGTGGGVGWMKFDRQLLCELSAFKEPIQ